MTTTLEYLSPAIVARTSELRKRVEQATTELTALLEAIEPPNTEIKRRVRLCLREAAHNIQRALNYTEAVEDLCLLGEQLAEYPEAELGTPEYIFQ
jgi:hypothetical protein